jgi:hypothetical protein
METCVHHLPQSELDTTRPHRSTPPRRQRRVMFGCAVADCYRPAARKQSSCVSTDTRGWKHELPGPTARCIRALPSQRLGKVTQLRPSARSASCWRRTPARAVRGCRRSRWLVAHAPLGSTPVPIAIWGATDQGCAATDQNGGCHRSKSGVHATGIRDAHHQNGSVHDRDEGFHQPARRGRGIENGGATDRNAGATNCDEGCTRSEPGMRPSGIGDATSRKWPSHRSEIPLPLFGTPQVTGETRLDPRSGTPSFQEVTPLIRRCGAPTLQHVDPLT